MLVPVLLFIVGLLFLIKGGDWFVDGASALARRFHLPELLIGATVVSIGTTLPEVMVSTMSAVSGHGEIAYGNAIGSVICNSALIAAITIAVRPGKVDPKTLKTPVIFFFIAAAIYCVAAYGFGKFTRPMGFIMLAMFVAYMVANVRQMKNAPAEEHAAPDAFANQLLAAMNDHAAELDEIITTHLKGWTLSRVPRVSLVALRLALAEMLYGDEQKPGVAINEAVELVKKYGAEDDYQFVNGLLGAVARERGETPEPQC